MGAIILHAMQVVEIDTRLQPVQRAGYGITDILRPGIDAPLCDIISIAQNAALGGQYDVMTQRVITQHTAHQHLVVAKAVDIGRIEKPLAPLDGVVQQVTGLRLITGAIELGHAHAAQTHGTDLETIRASLTFGQ